MKIFLLDFYETVFFLDASGQKEAFLIFYVLGDPSDGRET